MIFLDTDIYTNKKNYFFTMLGPRFDPSAYLMAQALEKEFRKEFIPIFIYAVEPNDFFKKDNYLVLNPKAEAVQKESIDPVVYLQEYEDMNVDFIESDVIKEISSRLFLKQDVIFIHSFTSSFFDGLDQRFKIIGPEPKVAKYYDNKINQYELFKEMSMPVIPGRICNNKNEVRLLVDQVPFYITASYSSGGHNGKVISCKKDLEVFFSELAEGNGAGGFLISDVFNNLKLAPNSSAVVTGPNEVSVLAITDQILRGKAYLGNVYPSAINQSQEEQIIKMTVRLGQILSEKGFRGLFGCDFLINDKDEMVVVDLNPRRQGGYVCNMLVLKYLGVNLANVELQCALGRDGFKTKKLDYDLLKPDYCWAHSKVKPYQAGEVITNEVLKGDLGEVFHDKEGLYSATFYKKGSLIKDGFVGYVVAKGELNKKAEIVKLVQDTADNLLKKCLADHC